MYTPRLRLFTAASASALVVGAFLAASTARASEFEGAHVHPLEISPDRTKLFAVHTPDARVAIFDLTAPNGPVRLAVVPVGLEPVTVRARNDQEVWVVNNLSDTISLLDVATGNVTRTLFVGDEPTDVVFAGDPERAFVCLQREGRIAVYDPNDLDATPISIPLQQARPRSLAVSPDGSKVYVAAFDSGNQTTVVHAKEVLNGGGQPPADPPMRYGLPIPPKVALIVKNDGYEWRDESGRSWAAFLPYVLADKDVIEISTSILAETRAFQNVGTNLFNVGVHPSNGRLYVTNQEALNEVRFEPKAKGRFARTRITSVDLASGLATPRHLNEHIDYSDESGNDGERALSLAFPLDFDFSEDGQSIYVAAMGSRKVAVLDQDGAVVKRISVGQAPTSVRLDEARGRMYVLHRVDSTIGVVTLADESYYELALGYDATPFDVREGRWRFYDARNSSAHGDLSCATCHLFGDTDGLAWDLGDPQGDFAPPPFPGLHGFHPMKGPMMTQSLKGLADTGPLHWRGDREHLESFNPAFVKLQGRSEPLDPDAFAQFDAFVMSLRYPSNPLRLLDGGLPFAKEGEGDPAHGEEVFFRPNVVGFAACADCHELPRGTNGQIFDSEFAGFEQDMKVPHLRTLYTKVGFELENRITVRGFGYTHDGSFKNLVSFLHGERFLFNNEQERIDLAAYLFAFDTGTPPSVGAQWTMDGTNQNDGAGRLAILQVLADNHVAGLIAKGFVGDELRGWTYVGAGRWISDRVSDGELLTSALLAYAGAGTEVTFTGVLDGDELRLGVDRDGDGFRDRDERDAGFDPEDAEIHPLTADVEGELGSYVATGLEPIRPNPALGGVVTLRYRLHEPTSMRLLVHDVQGRRVRTVVEEGLHPSGRFERTFDLKDERGAPLPGGVYFVKMDTRRGSSSTRLIIQK